MREITIAQARRFLLTRQGLMGKHIFTGKSGALAYVRQAGCIQYDPVDVCGRNAELTLQSRVKGFRKQMLHELLYSDRALVDYCDKELSIWPVEDWPYFEPYREKSKALSNTFAGIPELAEKAIACIRENGPVSSDTLPVEGEIFWHSSMHWSGNWNKKSKAARSVLEQLYTDGVLLIHHKNGTRKFYDLAEKYIDPAILEKHNPCKDRAEWLCWRVLRRIGAVGLLWNRRSDALLGVDLDNRSRDEAFLKLLDDGRILELQVEGIRFPVYMRSCDMPLLESLLCGASDTRKRMEFLAPLDPMLWDRKLIEALFGFRYSWEIYTPPEKRKYGYYTLPVLYGDRFIGRIEAAADPKKSILTVRNIWYEPDVRKTKALKETTDKTVSRFSAFNLCKTIIREDQP